MATPFLMQQLEWREALDEARTTGDAAAIDALRAALDARRDALRAATERALDVDADTTAAAESVRQWMFVERFGEDVRAGGERLQSAAT